MIHIKEIGKVSIPIMDEGQVVRWVTCGESNTDMGTEPMTDSKENKTTIVDEAIEQLKSGTYITKCGEYLVGEGGYGVELAKNPMAVGGYFDHYNKSKMSLSEDLLEELLALVRVRDTKLEMRSKESDLRWAGERLKQIKEDK